MHRQAAPQGPGVGGRRVPRRQRRRLDHRTEGGIGGHRTQRDEHAVTLVQRVASRQAVLNEVQRGHLQGVLVVGQHQVGHLGTHLEAHALAFEPALQRQRQAFIRSVERAVDVAGIGMAAQVRGVPAQVAPPFGRAVPAAQREGGGPFQPEGRGEEILVEAIDDALPQQCRFGLAQQPHQVVAMAFAQAGGPRLGGLPTRRDQAQAGGAPAGRGAQALFLHRDMRVADRGNGIHQVERAGVLAGEHAAATHVVARGGTAARVQRAAETGVGLEHDDVRTRHARVPYQESRARQRRDAAAHEVMPAHPPSPCEGRGRRPRAPARRRPEVKAR